MRLKSTKRVALFTVGSALSHSLGCLFQNPMELTAHDIQSELIELELVVQRRRREEKKYRKALLKLKGKTDE